MENTYLDYFNYYLKEFCNELINNFPEYKTPILENYRPLLEGRDNKNDLYCKYFLNNVNSSIDDICAKRVEMFSTDEPLNFLVGVNFNELWVSDTNNEEVQQAIWKYLQLLALLSRNVVPELEEITSLLEKVGGEIEAPAKMLRTFADEESAGDKSDSGNSFEMLNAISMVSNLFKNGGGATFDNIKGLLSGVLKSLGMEDFEETLNKFNIDEIISSLGLEGKEFSMDTIQEVLGDPEKMKDILNKLTENLDSCSAGEENGMLGQVLMMMKSMLGMFNMSPTSTTADGEESSSSSQENSEEAPQLGDMFSNMMKTMMNNDAVNQMAADMESGKQVNPMDMLSSLMGNADIMNMAKNMAQNNPSAVRQAQKAKGRNRDMISREQLRAKVKKSQNEKK